MVRGQFRVSAVKAIVSVSRPVLPSVDRPVATDADLVELTGPNIRGLLRREACAEVMLERQRVGTGCAVCLEGLNEAVDRLNALRIASGHAEDLIHGGNDSTLVLCLKGRVVPHKDGPQVLHLDALRSGSIREADDQKVVLSGSGCRSGELIHSPGFNA